MRRVNQGSINAESAAGLTYPTQLLMLNARPQQQTGQEQGNINEASCGVCSACVGLCAQGLTGVKSMGVGVGSTRAPCFLGQKQVLLLNDVWKYSLPMDLSHD